MKTQTILKDAEQENFPLSGFQKKEVAQLLQSRIPSPAKGELVPFAEGPQSQQWKERTTE